MIIRTCWKSWIFLVNFRSFSQEEKFFLNIDYNENILGINKRKLVTKLCNAGAWWKCKVEFITISFYHHWEHSISYETESKPVHPCDKGTHSLRVLLLVLQRESRAIILESLSVRWLCKEEEESRRCCWKTAHSMNAPPTRCLVTFSYELPDFVVGNLWPSFVTFPNVFPPACYAALTWA